MIDYKYGNLYKKYDMEGIIEVGTGELMVHDIFEDTPQFMKKADLIFVDPPCNSGNLHGFYTKADMSSRVEYSDFENRLFEVIDEISPKVLVMELFKSNVKRFMPRLEGMYANVNLHDSMYYKNSKNKCWIAVASNGPLPNALDSIDGMDEEDVVSLICREVDFECIGDPCMGKGIVAFYANRNGRKFVGTELNKYRLAVAVERVVTNDRGKIN